MDCRLRATIVDHHTAVEYKIQDGGPIYFRSRTGPYNLLTSFIKFQVKSTARKSHDKNTDVYNIVISEDDC